MIKINNIGDVNRIRNEKWRVSTMNNYKKALYIIDMNNGFVNFGAMANPEYNKLVPEQLKMIDKFRKENQLVNFILEGHVNDALEFKKYPKHCIYGTPEADLIPEFINEVNKKDTLVRYKNSINGMFNKLVQDDIVNATNLKEIVVEGVCTDLCVMYFVINMLTYLDEINKYVKLFVVKNAIDTFNSPGHNREEWTNIAYKVLTQAGAILVEDIDELESKEKQYKLI